MSEIDQNLNHLLLSNDWTNLQLAGQLIQGLGFQPSHLEKLIFRISQLYLHEFIPEFTYHRIGCSMLDKTTYYLIFNKLNEFLSIPYLEVEVCSDYVNFEIYVQIAKDKPLIPIHIVLEDYTQNLFFSVRSQFSIGEKLLNNS